MPNEALISSLDFLAAVGIAIGLLGLATLATQFLIKIYRENRIKNMRLLSIKTTHFYMASILLATLLLATLCIVPTHTVSECRVKYTSLEDHLDTSTTSCSPTSDGITKYKSSPILAIIASIPLSLVFVFALFGVKHDSFLSSLYGSILCFFPSIGINPYLALIVPYATFYLFISLTSQTSSK
tara:strand:+ start:711 stop:1259 length:549 start_codon:yes stop_codon:yes gene_type:complete